MGPYLSRLARHGVPAPSSATPWQESRLRHVLRRGPHTSALHQFKSFFFEDLFDMVSKGYWAILPYNAIWKLPHLKLSPAGVVPQRTRRPRPIMDYSFTGVNEASLQLAPKHAMQLGHALPRLLQRIAYADRRHGPPLLMKLDLSDGYYRVRLSPEAALELAVVLPPLRPGTTLIGIPLSLPMGWNQSPPYFCTFTETVADMANHAIETNQRLPPHPVEHRSQNHEVPRSYFAPNIVSPQAPSSLTQPLAYVDIYIDDFIGLAQPARAQHTLRATLHSLDKIFRPYPHPSDKPNRKLPLSMSKLMAGDGAWSTSKIILGWQLDTAAGTSSLPSHKAQRLCDLLAHFVTRRRSSRKRWCQLLGELRHMSTAIKGASYLFSILQHVLVDQPTARRLRLSSLVRRSLEDWQQIATSLATNPVPIASLVPRPPHYIGSVDASGFGVGGFWVPTSIGALTRPLLFRYPFPPYIQQQLVSASNTSGTLNNSEFELAAIILGASIISRTSPSSHDNLLCGSDNSAAVSWCTKGSVSSKGPSAHLLRWLAQISRDRFSSLTPTFVSGDSNALADFCSRSFSLTDDEFLQKANAAYPIKPSWTIIHPTAEEALQLTSALSSTMLPWASHTSAPCQPILPGTSGPPFATPLTSTQPSKTQMIPFSPYNFLPLDTAVANYLPANLKYAVKRWATPFVPLDRRSPTWDSRIPASNHPENYNSALVAN
jgi:hypothetical protein